MDRPPTHLDRAIEPRHPAQQPAAQRPRAVVAAVDGQDGVCHASPLAEDRARPRIAPASALRAAPPARLRVFDAPSVAACDPGKERVFQRLAHPTIIISHCNKKCTNFSAPGFELWAGVPLRRPRRMLYQAYQAHSDIMVPVRAWAGAALHAFAPMNGMSGARPQEPHRRLRADRARRADPCSPGLRHRHRDGRQRGIAGASRRRRTPRRSARCCGSPRMSRRRSRACCSSRRSRGISRRCCATP